MIDLQKLKVVVFDFDDTLCVHTEHGSYDRQKTRDYFKAMINGKNWWDANGAKPSKAMQMFIDLLKERDIPMYLCSAVTSSIHATRKVAWVSKKYGVYMSDLCVAEPEDKLNALLALVDALSVERDSILIVDDYYAVVESVANAGFQSATPVEAIEFYEDTKQKVSDEDIQNVAKN